MQKILSFLVSLLFLSSCAATKVQYIPVQGEHIIEYRDSIIRYVDTVTIEIPKEKVVEVVPEVDTSYLETKLAYSTAYLDRNKRTIHHTLEHKETALKTQIDTVIITQTKTEYMEKPVIETVEVEKPYIPTLFWIAMCYMVLSLGLKIYRVISKLL
jgi:hypothetical protein